MREYILSQISPGSPRVVTLCLIRGLEVFRQRESIVRIKSKDYLSKKD